MKRNFILAGCLIFLSVLILPSCGEETTSEIIIKDGLIYKEGEEKPFTGKIEDIVNEKFIEYDVVDGMKNGKFRIAYKNGNTEMEGTIKNNLNEGLWKYYHPNGNIESEGLFVNDKPDGLWKWYYPDGKIREEGYFKMGERTGEWKRFDEKGNQVDTIKIQVQAQDQEQL